MTTVIVPAHDEAAVIDRLLELFAGYDLDVVVACNGCTDDTAARARAHPGVRVVEIAEPSKAAALQAGDDASAGWPRAYVDADVELGGAAVTALARAVAEAGALAGSVGLRVDDRVGSWAVRSYYRVWSALPQIRDGLAGRGIYMLTQEGRARFERWPALLGDDYFVDRLFTPAERVVLHEHESTVETPATVRQLVRRKVRVHAGNAQVAGTTGMSHRSGLVPLLRERPSLLPHAVVYTAVTAWAKLVAKRPRSGWGRGRAGT